MSNLPNIKVTTSPDKLSAFITVEMFGNDDGVKTEQIQSELDLAGVIFGIKNDVITDLEGCKENIPKTLIASGKEPQLGKDGAVTILKDTELSACVKKGEKLAKVLLPEEGVAGINVLNEQIPVDKPKDVRTPEIINIERLKDDGDFFLSTVDGYFNFSDEKLEVQPYFELEISDDGLEANLKIAKQQNVNDFSMTDLTEFLNSNNVVYGVEQNNLKNNFNEKEFGKTFLAAKGDKPIDGKDGRANFLFETHVGPKEDEKGNVDHKTLGLIQNFKKGDPLVEIVDPTEGKPGMTIGKEIIPAQNGKPLEIRKGEGVETDPKNPNIMIAGQDGHVKFADGVLTIDPLTYVSENVDYSTGNIVSEGSVFVKGEVKSGFSIKATGDIEINGLVEDATIESGGNVFLKSGFTGRGQGSINASKTVIALFCENQTVISYEDISFCQYIMRCNVITHKKLIVTEKKGRIIGGKIIAQEGVEANEIGNDSYVPTEIIVGTNIDAQEKLANAHHQINQLREKDESIKAVYDKIYSQNPEDTDMPEDKQEIIASLKASHTQLAADLKACIAEIEKIKEEMSKFKSSKVIVHQKLHPHTKITIFDRHLEIKEEEGNVCIEYDEEDAILKIVPLK